MAKKKSPKIDQTLLKMVENMSKESTPSSSSIEPAFLHLHDLPGDPDCPLCHGVGYLRVDVPVGHPEFGKLRVCDCRQGQVNQIVRQRLYELSHLEELGHLTFENFQPRGRVGLLPMQAESLETAFNQAQLYAHHLTGWLLLQGSYGCGKTHLAAAIANFAVSLGVPTLFITVPDLLDTLRFAYHDPEATFEERFEQVRSAPLLILDDFGTQNATTWAQEKLFQILNYRYINKLPLVVTTNYLEQDLDDRIASRLGDPELVSRVRILAIDYRNPTMEFGHSGLSSLQSLPNHTFASFELRKNENLNTDHLASLENALKAAIEFARNPRGWLVIIGPYGCGKTHLAAAIGHSREDKGDLPILVSVPDFLDHLRATFSPNSTVSLDRRFEEVRKASLLILDDLGTQVATPWAKEKLFQLLNHRYDADLPTVITTATKLEDMEPRIRSRMQDRRLCRIVAITAPTYTGNAPQETKRSQHRSRAK
jgi:DNA replication protein DnaC